MKSTLSSAILAGTIAIGAEGCTGKPQAQSPQLNVREDTVIQGAHGIRDRVFEEVIAPCNDILREQDSTVTEGGGLEMPRITVTSVDEKTTCTYLSVFGSLYDYSLGVSTPGHKATTVVIHPVQIILLGGQTDSQKLTVDSWPIKDKWGIYQHGCTVTDSERGGHNIIGRAPLTVAKCSLEIADMRAMGAWILRGFMDKTESSKISTASKHSKESQ